MEKLLKKDKCLNADFPSDLNLTPRAPEQGVKNHAPEEIRRQSLPTSLNHVHVERKHIKPAPASFNTTFLGRHNSTCMTHNKTMYVHKPRDV